MKYSNEYTRTLLREVDIKAIILNLPKIRRFRPVVASEYFVGRRARRADLVIMTNKILAFEIKSDHDNLGRLDKQTDEYLKYFDNVTIAATSKHIPKILELARPDVSVWEVQSNRQIAILRKGLKSSTKTPNDLLRLLTKSESRRLLKPVGHDQPVDVDQISDAFAKAFKARHAAASRRFWEMIESRSAVAADLELLSRFIDLRIKAADHAERSATFWAHWHASVEQLLPASRPTS